jgi:threonine dehydrogenase-like Zn-dependent dehydrogenase
MFDKQVQLRMGQCNVRRWTDEILPLVEDDADPLGVMDLVTHPSGLDSAPALCEKFRKKEDNCIKVVLNPGA